MPVMLLLDVMRELDDEVPISGEQEGLEGDRLPFVHDGEDGMFLVICESGLVGVWLHNWKELNRVRLGNLESIIGPPSAVQENGNDYASPDPDKGEEWSNTLAVWGRPLTPLEVRDLIYWCRDSCR